MMDQSRIALCMLLLGVCFVIPYAPEAFKSSFPTEEEVVQQPTIGRSILSEESFRYPPKLEFIFTFLLCCIVFKCVLLL